MTQKQLINANNAELNNVKAEVAKLPMADDVKNGRYVWGKYDAKGGTLLSFTISDSETAYPDGGEKDGFWWEMVKEIFEQGVLVREVDAENNIIDVLLKGKIATPRFKPWAEQMHLEKAQMVEVVFGEIALSGMSDVFRFINPNGKVKIRTRKIGELAFDFWGYGNGSSGTKVWISNETEEIIAGTSSSAPFHTNKSGVTINFYCEHESKPAKWSQYWNYVYVTANTVMWGVTESQFDAL